ncbi:hypothetical protein [Streptomyces sp. NPDC000410]|uniref:hypothetical protein n=1 Tax=Streptomyces sp. NPDC000410 TaxID=3154254 RepID=UPI00331B31F2
MSGLVATPASDRAQSALAILGGIGEVGLGLLQRLDERLVGLGQVHPSVACLDDRLFR